MSDHDNMTNADFAQGSGEYHCPICGFVNDVPPSVLQTITEQAGRIKALEAVAQAAKVLANNHSPLDPYVYELNKAIRAAGYGGEP